MYTLQLLATEAMILRAGCLGFGKEQCPVAFTGTQ